MKEVLITGGAGYLGLHVVEKLLKNEYKVNVLDNFSFGNSGLKSLKKRYNFKLIDGDIRDLRVVLKSMDGVDVVIHLAGIVGDSASKLDSEQSIEVNYLSTKMLVDVVKYFKIRQFLFASSCSVYGASNSKILDESSKLSPVSLYADTKIKSEKIILESSGKYFSPTILRAGTLFGFSNRMRFDLVINLFVAQAIFEHKISIEGGQQWRPFVHVDDAAEVYVRALELPSSKIQGIFNLGSNHFNYKLIDIGKLITEQIPNTKVKFSKTVDNRNYRVNFSKLAKILKYVPEKSVEYGIQEIKNKIESKIIKSWKDPIYYNNKISMCMGKNKQTQYYWK